MLQVLLLLLPILCCAQMISEAYLAENSEKGFVSITHDRAFIATYGEKTYSSSLSNKEHKAIIEVEKFSERFIEIDNKRLVVDLPAVRSIKNCKSFEFEHLDKIESYFIRCSKIKAFKEHQAIYLLKVNILIKDQAVQEKTLVFDSNQKRSIQIGQHQIVIKNKAHPQFKRTRFALALGAYERENKWMPSLLSYGNYYLSEDSSIRGFNVLIEGDSLFNNVGLYYATDFSWEKLKLTTLLGVQHIYDENTRTNEVILPQGGELQFELYEQNIGVGLLIDPSSSYEYQNLWLRAGKRVFAEINYIEWIDGNSHISTWGLSLAMGF